MNEKSYATEKGVIRYWVNDFKAGAITLVFLPAVSSFVIPKMLGGGDYVLIGNLIEIYFQQTGDWNFGSAISLIMALIIIGAMWATKKLDSTAQED